VQKQLQHPGREGKTLSLPSPLPEVIMGTIIELEDEIMNESLRRRLRPLIGHLPTASAFRFAEVSDDLDKISACYEAAR
jgi:hypothetical protein